MPNIEPRIALETAADAQAAEAARLLGELRSLREDLHARFQQADGRLQRIEGRFQQVDSRLLQIDGRFLQIDGRFLQLKSRFQHGDEKIDRQFTLLVGTLVAAIGAFMSALMALYVH
jgi:hypothetical protein